MNVYGALLEFRTASAVVYMIRGGERNPIRNRQLLWLAFLQPNLITEQANITNQPQRVMTEILAAGAGMGWMINKNNATVYGRVVEQAADHYKTKHSLPSFFEVPITKITFPD